MFNWKKKNDDRNQDLDILEDIKEPFSIQNFFEDHVVSKFKEFKQLLDDHGIIFFLVSPFQYRNRLLIKVALIVLGITIGVVPRTVSLVNQTKARNALSELANVNPSYTSGALRIEPLESSQYDKQHLMVFKILGNTADGIPSTNDKYKIELKASRGAVDVGNIEYAYDIIPISNSERLLVVHVDNRNQNDETGIYNLFVEVAQEELSNDKRRPIEIILSNSQETTSLFNEEGVDLALLSAKMLKRTDRPIEKAQADLEQALSGYALLYDRLRSIGLTPVVSYDDMTAHAQKMTQLPDISDDSSVRDIPRDAAIHTDDDGGGRPLNVAIVAQVQYGDETYSSNQSKDIPSDMVRSELSDLQVQTNMVTESIKRLNTAQRNHFNELVALGTTLNQGVDPQSFTTKVNVLP